MSDSLTSTKIPFSGNSSVVSFPLLLKDAVLYLHGSLHGLLGVDVWAEQSLQPAAGWGQWEVLWMLSLWPTHSAQLTLPHHSFSARFSVFFCSQDHGSAVCVAAGLSVLHGALEQAKLCACAHWLCIYRSSQNGHECPSCSVVLQTFLLTLIWNLVSRAG